MGKERRRWPRLDCHLEIGVKAASVTTNTGCDTSLDALLGISAVSKNFSLYGLCIKTAHSTLREKDRVYLTIETPMEVRPLELESEVVWNSGDEIGVRFIDVNIFDEIRLKDCFDFFRDVFSPESGHALS